MKDGKMQCDDIPPSGVKAQVCMDNVLSQESGTGTSITEKITTFTGHQSSTTTVEKQSMEIISNVQMTMSENAIFEKMKIDADLKTDFSSSLESTYTDSSESWKSTEITVTVNADKPSYIYTDQGSLQIGGHGWFIMTHPAEVICTDYIPIGVSSDITRNLPRVDNSSNVLV